MSIVIDFPARVALGSGYANYVATHHRTDAFGKRDSVPAVRVAHKLGEPREGVLGLALVLLTFAGWCQHLHTCVHEGDWEFLIAGAVISPMGIIHGWSVWLMG